MNLMNFSTLSPEEFTIWCTLCQTYCYLVLFWLHVTDVSGWIGVQNKHSHQKICEEELLLHGWDWWYWSVSFTNESLHRRLCVCVYTHRQHAALVLFSVVENILQGQSVLLGEFLQSSSLAVLHLVGLLFALSLCLAHVLLVGRLLLTQSLPTIKDR